MEFTWTEGYNKLWALQFFRGGWGHCCSYFCSPGKGFALWLRIRRFRCKRSCRDMEALCGFYRGAMCRVRLPRTLHPSPQNPHSLHPKPSTLLNPKNLAEPSCECSLRGMSSNPVQKVTAKYPVIEFKAQGFLHAYPGREAIMSQGIAKAIATTPVTMLGGFEVSL